MNTVYFDEYNSWEDFRLLLTSKKIESPAYKGEEIKIPGADGVLDQTEYFGEIKFENRKITLQFKTFGTRKELADITSAFQNAVQGRKMKLSFTDDEDFYYIGRVKIKTPSDKKNIRTFDLECSCEPYKYKMYETVIKKYVDTVATIHCPNLRKSVIPEITTDASVQIIFKDVTYSVDAGTFIMPEIYFTEGVNTLNVIGTANVTIKYREGGL